MNSFVRSRGGRPQKHGRRGATAVEFALAAPLLFLMIFAAIEFSRVNMLRHTVAEAAYEGARRGIVPGATATNVRDAATGIVRSASGGAFSVDVFPATILPETETVTCTISLPVSGNTWGVSMFFGGKTLQKSCTMQRERLETVSVP